MVAVVCSGVQLHRFILKTVFLRQYDEMQTGTTVIKNIIKCTPIKTERSDFCQGRFLLFNSLAVGHLSKWPKDSVTGHLKPYTWLLIALETQLALRALRTTLRLFKQSWRLIRRDSLTHFPFLCVSCYTAFPWDILQQCLLCFFLKNVYSVVRHEWPPKMWDESGMGHVVYDGSLIKACLLGFVTSVICSVKLPMMWFITPKKKFKIMLRLKKM